MRKKLLRDFGSQGICSNFAPGIERFQTRLWARDSHELVSGPFQDSSWLKYLNLQFMENVILALPAECWRWVPSYEGLYQVSTRGRVRSVDRWVIDTKGRKQFIKGKILKPGRDKKGYLFVCLCRDGKQRNCKVHRLVAMAWLDNPDNKPEVNHRDEDKTNADVFNLSYCTHKENANWGTATKRRTDKLSKQVQAVDPKTGLVVMEFPSIMEAGRNGFSKTCISFCCRGKYRQHKGYIWRYKQE